MKTSITVSLDLEQIAELNNYAVKDNKKNSQVISEALALWIATRKAQDVLPSAPLPPGITPQALPPAAPSAPSLISPTAPIKAEPEKKKEIEKKTKSKPKINPKGSMSQRK